MLSQSENSVSFKKEDFSKQIRTCVIHEAYRAKDGQDVITFVFNDEEPMNPREDAEMLGTMVHCSTTYLLGDKRVRREDLEGLPEKWQGEPVIALPVYAYIHGGVTISTSPFTCRWDSGLAGFIFITHAKAKSEYNRKHLSKKFIDKIKSYLEAEVKEFDKYLTGEVYGYQTFDVLTGAIIDSCWGIFDSPAKIMANVKAGNY